MRRIMAVVAVVLGIGCAAESPTSVEPAQVPDDRVPLLSIGEVIVFAPPAATHRIRLQPEAQLLITSNVAEVTYLRVAWHSEIGGTYRETFVVEPLATRTIWPDCFYRGRYMIRAGSWGRTVDYGPGVAYCFDVRP